MRRTRSWVSRGNVEGLETILRSKQRFFYRITISGKILEAGCAWWVCNVDKEKDGKGSEKGGVVLNEQENPVLLQRPVKVSACGFWWINQQQHLRPQKKQELIAQSCSDRLVRAAEQRITGGGWCTCSREGHLVAEYNAELRPCCIRETLKLIMCLQVAEKMRFSIIF